jgi:hypothetical protein
MTGFDFFFGFFGLMLGFSVTAVTRGLATIISRRRFTSVSALAAALAVFMLLDLIWLWVFAWDSREYLGVNFSSLYAGMALAIIYYFAAITAFPEDMPEEDRALIHYWSSKRLVVGAIMIVNACALAHWLYFDPSRLSRPWWWADQLAYWLPLAALLITRSVRLDIVLWLFLVAGFFTEAAGELIADTSDKPAESAASTKAS